ncbi:MFS transporter [Deinococcus sp. KSM4-11]|uniref:MFS transporter n=1 Tax=Deinococcus sp. KSM4-11 TaxID=2568654 RepID=UPI001454C4A4|nr:MFS transporter [Deinococcus sp. KSM4-11]
MKRWSVLAAYALVTASTQLLWITYAPITKESAAALHTTVENVGWLSAIFQLIYILLALPAGRWLDRRFPAALGTGAVLLALGALLRVIAPQSFALQLAGQVAVAVAQPLVLGALTGLGTRYFPAAERPTAVAIGSASIFVGILLATLSGPALYAAGGLGRVLLVQAIPALLGAAWLLASLRTPAPYPAPAGEDGSLAWLRRDPFMWRLGGLLFLGFGIFIALSTWMEAILGFYGVTSVMSGTLLGVMVFAGILGSALLPPLVAARDQRRPLMVVALLLCGVALAAIAWRHGLPWLGGWLFVTGFFLLATLPVVLEWAERHAGPARQGAAVGFLMLLGNAGGLVLVLVVQGLIAGPSRPLLALGVAVLVALPFALGLPGQTRGIRAA